MTYKADVTLKVKLNTAFRKVLFTGKNSQIVAMSLHVDDDIGSEKHDKVEQTVQVVGGQGLATVGKASFRIAKDDLIVVEPKTEHNFTNTGPSPLKLLITYAPPNHVDGTVHKTKADAEADSKDEAFEHEA